MRAVIQGLSLYLCLVALSGSASGTGPANPQSRQPAVNRPSSTSWCLAKCNELEVACKSFENRYPSCSPSDICLEEKHQCETQCRPRVKLTVSAWL